MRRNRRGLHVDRDGALGDEIVVKIGDADGLDSLPDHEIGGRLVDRSEGAHEKIKSGAHEHVVEHFDVDENVTMSNLAVDEVIEEKSLLR